MSGPSTASSSERTISLVCLGTGHGGSMVYGGVCSAAYVVCVDKAPVLLVGAGFGVVQQCLRFFGRIPSDVFVTSNRSHMAAELPVLLAVEANRRDAPLRLLAHPTVLQRLEGHRLAELHQVMELRGDVVSSLVDLCPVPPCDVDDGVGSDPFEHAEGVVLRDAPGISVRSIVTQTSECSAGVAIYCAHSGGLPIFALTGDASNASQLLSGSLRRFHCVVVDGRREPSADHSSFADLEVAVGDAFGKRRLDKLHKCFVGHYGGPEEAPIPSGHPAALQPAIEGMLVHVHYRVTLCTQALPRGSEGALGSSASVVDVQVTLLKDLLPQHSARTGPARNFGGVGSESGGDVLLPPSKRRSREAQTRVRPPKTMASVDIALPTGVPAAAGGGAIQHRTVRQRSPSPLLRLQQPTASSARRNSSSSTRRASVRHHDPDRVVTPPGKEGSSRLDRDAVNDGATAPKRIYLFSNEDKSAPGRLLMAHTFRTMQQLKLKAAEVLSIRPIGELYTVPSGMHVVSVEQLSNGCCVIATKSGGEAFSMSRLPKALSHRQRTSVAGNAATDGPNDDVAENHGGVSNLTSPKQKTHRRSEERTARVRSSPRDTQPGASPHMTSQFSDFMAQASAILSSADRQVSIVEPRVLVDHASAYRSNAANHVVAGALPIGSGGAAGDVDMPSPQRDTNNSLLPSDQEDDIFGERRVGNNNNNNKWAFDTADLLSSVRPPDQSDVSTDKQGTRASTRRQNKKLFSMVSL